MAMNPTAYEKRMKEVSDRMAELIQEHASVRPAEAQAQLDFIKAKENLDKTMDMIMSEVGQAMLIEPDKLVFPGTGKPNDDWTWVQVRNRAVQDDRYQKALEAFYDAQDKRLSKEARLQVVLEELATLRSQASMLSSAMFLAGAHD